MSFASGGHAHSPAEMARRKAQHLDICIDEETYEVESGRSRLDEVRLLHRSLPEIDGAAVDTTATFLGHTVQLPFFISSMTGGSEAGYQTNKDLATVAQELGIPVGMGSIRILLRKPEVIGDFELKRFAPDVPVFANIGGVQLPTTPHDDLVELMKRLDVDGIAIHLNPGQEIFQPGGDIDFRGVRDAIARFVEVSPRPVIVKETGLGINPAEVDALLAVGVHAVDVAGSGGTSWLRVEAYRRDDRSDALDAAAEFDDWGLPTALILAALGRERRQIVASGGIRSGRDIVAALALGAESVGLALPFVRALKRGGVEGALALGQRLKYVIESAMALAGCDTIEALRTAPVMVSSALRTDADELRRVCSKVAVSRTTHMAK